ncbi:MAG: flagellin [Phycisphaerales bacterium]
MARINSNIPSLIARSNLGRANSELQVHLQRLSTGLQINRGADNPAGLIISERLRSEVSGLNQAVDNSDRASSVIATAEGGLAEVSDLLSSIKALVVEAANTGAISDEERKANQLQIDSAIESITRISNSVSFGGLKLLNGSLDYVLSGLSATAINKATIHGANFAGQSNIQVNVNVINSAQTASLFLSASTGTFLSSVNMEVAGPLGVQTLQILSGQSVSDIARAINDFRQATGISAALINPGNPTSGLRFDSIEFGSGQFVSVKRLNGPADGGFFRTYAVDGNGNRGTISFSDAGFLASLTSSNRDRGRDVSAIVNGNVATGNGLRLSLENQTSLSLELSLTQTLGTTNASTTTFYITGGGALYQLGGEVNTSQQTNIGIQSVAASRLGGTLINDNLEFLASLRSGGSNDLRSERFENASKILQTAIDEIAVIRGRLGAFERNTLQTNVRSLQAAIENLTASESQIRDADFAAETSKLTRAQILSSASTTVLSLANQQSQQVLQLLG